MRKSTPRPAQVVGQHVRREAGLLLVEVDGDDRELDRRPRAQLDQDVEQRIAVLAARDADHHPVAVLDHREVGDRAADLAVQALAELGDLDRELAARRRHGATGWRQRAWPRFLQCAGARGLGRQQCIGGPRATRSAWRSTAPAAGSRSAASWRSRSTRPVSATTRAAGRSSAACPRAAATSSPRPSCRRCSARRWRASCAQALDASGSDEVWEFGAGSRRARRRSCSARSAIACRRYTIVELSAPLRERQRDAPRALRRRACAGSTRCRRDPRRRRRQRGARRDAGRAAALRRRRLARARRGRGERAGASSPGRDRPTRASGRRSATPFPAGQHDRAACAGRGLRRDARRAPRARRDLPDRLRLSRSRVLPPAARRRHADVPPRAPRRHRSAGRRRREGHHRHVDFTASRSPARTPASTSSATRRRRASCSTAASASCWRGPTCASASTRRSSSTSTRWASCSRCSRSPRA